MFLFIKLSRHWGFACETVLTAWLGDSLMYLCFYLLSFFICSLFLKKSLGFGEIKSLALNVAKQTDWNDPKCQHAVTGCSQKDTGRCNFIFCRFVVEKLVFYLHWIPQWPSQRRQCRTYLLVRIWILWMNKSKTTDRHYLILMFDCVDWVKHLAAIITLLLPYLIAFSYVA